MVARGCRIFGHLLIALLLAWPALANARDHLLFVSQAEGTSEIVAGDIQKNQQIAGYFNSLFGDLIQNRLEATNIVVRSLNELPAAVDRTLGRSGRVAGVVLLGHGSVTNFALTATATYSGQELARAIFNSVKDRAARPELLIYLKACSCGIESSDGKSSVQIDLLAEMQRLNEIEPRWKEVHSIAHQDFNSNATSALSRPYTKFQHLFFKSGLARLFYKFEMVVSKSIGGRAGVNKEFSTGLAKTFAVSLGLAVVSNFFAGEPELVKNVVVSALTFGGGVITLTPLIQALSHTRESWVNIRSLGVHGMTESISSSVYSSFRMLLPQMTGIRCESVYTN